MRNTRVAPLLAICACGGDDGGANAQVDAPPTNVSTITMSGKAEEISAQGSVAQAGVLVEMFRNSDESTPIASTMTDAAGNYTLMVMTNGESIDGYIRATKAGFKKTFLYPPYPLVMDFDMASILMITKSTYDTLSSVAMADQQAGKGLVALAVTDGASMAIGGATVTSTPASTPMPIYNAMIGGVTLPSPMATTTHTDGVAYLFNMPPGKVTVGAAKGAMTFKSHSVKAWADEVTTTVVVP